MRLFTNVVTRSAFVIQIPSCTEAVTLDSGGATGTGVLWPVGRNAGAFSGTSCGKGLTIWIGPVYWTVLSAEWRCASTDAVCFRAQSNNKAGSMQSVMPIEDDASIGCSVARPQFERRYCGRLRLRSLHQLVPQEFCLPV